MVKSLVFEWVASRRVRPFATKVKMVAPGRKRLTKYKQFALAHAIPG